MEETIAYIDIENDIELPQYSGALKASGFEAPGGEFADSSLDLNKLMIKDPTATYFMRMQNADWVESHILPEDILIVDTSKSSPSPLSLVVCTIDGALTLRRIHYRNSVGILTTDTAALEEIEINNNDPFQIFGTVIGIIRKYA